MKKRRLISGFLVALLVISVTAGTVLASSTVNDLFDKVRNVYDVVNAWHKDGADPEKFTAGAIRGGLEALGDPYTNYYSAEDFMNFMDSLNGSFSGIGAYLEQDGNYVVVASPIKGSPAARAGLASGDRILEANGVPLIGESTDKAVQLIRGQAGTDVTLKIERPSEKRVMTLIITREQINLPEVEHKMLDGGIGYVQLASFGDDSVKDFYQAVEAIKAQNAKAMVLDLRQNGGGYLQAAIDIASAFVPKGETVVWEVGSANRVARESSGSLIGLPTVVLVDNGSASASEILAGAIQDHGAAPLVGVKTFGKGTVQQILTLMDGSGMKVTTAEYLTPKERHVHEVGLTPDYVVEVPKPDETRTTPLAFTRLLLPSSVGLDVQYVQYRLQDLGYQPDIHGFFGMNTSTAVTNFRKDTGLSEESKVDEVFMDSLNRKVAERVKGDQVDVQLQKAVELLQSTTK